MKVKKTMDKPRERNIWIGSERKRRCLFLLLGVVYFIQISLLPVRAATDLSEEVEIAGETAIVMEAYTGDILYEKNIHEEHYPASITKIMTALLAVENSNLEEEVVFSEDAVYKVEGSGIARDIGEVMTMEQCLYGMMLQSANECAYAIAEHVGGDYDTFIRMMNEKAQELGCKNTHFNNPNGLPDEEHYTCAYDMALISKAAFQNETFRTITGTEEYTIPPTNKHKEETYLRNTHKMLTNYKGAEYLYDGCIGGKTGYTDAARNTLVTFARRHEMTLICVVLNEEKSKQYLDTTTLLDYCFDNQEFVAAYAKAEENTAAADRLEAEELTNTGHIEDKIKAQVIPIKELQVPGDKSSANQNKKDIILKILAAVLALAAAIGIFFLGNRFYQRRRRSRYQGYYALKTIKEPRRRGRRRRRRKIWGRRY